MSIIEKYEIYKKGLVTRGTSVTLQKFFKTEPNMEQLLLLSELERQTGFNTTFWAVYAGVIGFIIGGATIALMVLFNLLTLVPKI
jgi:hypothetical protein